MLICPECRAENPDGKKFCGECGTPLQAVAEPRERRKLATLVFCDVAGSTALGEQVDAEAVRGLMLSYFAEAREVLERHGGTVEKFIGDAVVAAFGVPQVHEDDALRACRAALEIQEQLSSRITLRIGVNTGEVVAGDASSRESFVTGDAVNVAARLEQGAPAGSVLIGESTYRLVHDAVTVEAVDPLVAKGKSELLSAYRLQGLNGASAPRKGTALVGRGAELELLEREFDAAVAARRCRLVTVVGEPGVGKSRLAAELVGRIGARARVVRGTCLSYGEGITFWAIAQVVRELAGIDDALSGEEALARLDSPRLAQLLGLAEGSASADEITYAIERFLVAQAGSQPMVVLVDDIHWAEPALLELLTGLPASVDAPVLVLCLARPELVESHPGWDVAIRLEPLGATEVETLLESLAAPEAIRTRIAQASAGNPLFAEELVAWSREGGLDSGELPTSLNALLGARLDQLDSGARDALERGAVEGELFHRDAVVELSDPDSRTLVPATLDALTRKDVVRLAAATIAGQYAFRFKHILFRDAAYNATAKKLRAALHEQYANWLESFAGTRVAEYHEILGYHLEQAYRYRTELGLDDTQTRALGERAAWHLAPAGRRALDRGDNPAAVNLLQRALAVGLGDPRERARVQFELGFPLSEIGLRNESMAMLDASIEAATRLGERGLAMRARVERAQRRIDWSRPDPEASQVAKEAIETFTELGDRVGLAHAERLLGRSNATQGAEVLAAFERALAHADAAGDRVTRRRVVGTLVNRMHADSTPVADGIRRCEELRASSAEDRVLQAIVTQTLAAFYAMAGHSAEALDCVRESREVLDGLQVMNYRFAQRVTMELTGDKAAQEKLLREGWQEARKVAGDEPNAGVVAAAVGLAAFCCDEGRWDEAAEVLAQGGDFADDSVGPGGWFVGRLVVRARLAAHRGNDAEAVALIERAVEREERSESLNGHAGVQLALAEVHRAAGRIAEADAAVAYARELYERKGNVVAAARLSPAAIPA